ncbi:MAG: amidohydrolase family protein [Pirellulales bacterium]
MPAAQVITGRRYDTGEAVALKLESGKIASIAPLASTDVSTSDIAQLPFIAPGFVDLQVNGYGGQEFSSAELTVEKTVAIVRRMATFGVTRFCPTVTTAGFDVLAHAMATIAAACDAHADVERRVLGVHLEGPYISPIDGPRGAHPLVHCRPPDWNEFARLQDAAGGRIRLLTLSPEYDSVQMFIAQAVKSNVVVALGHTAATSDQIRAAVDAGATMSTHLGNGAHRELPRHPNYLWDQLADDHLTASLIVDGHHLPPEVVQTFLRAKTADRIVLISDLSGLAGMPPGRYDSELCDLEILADGRLVIAGQRQLLAGASRPIGDGVANLMAFAGVDLKTAVEEASLRPAQLLAAGSSAGRSNTAQPIGLTVGAPADLVLFDLAPPDSPAANAAAKLAVHQTIIAGATAWRDENRAR